MTVVRPPQYDQGSADGEVVREQCEKSTFQLQIELGTAAAVSNPLGQS